MPTVLDKIVAAKWREIDDGQSGPARGRAAPACRGSPAGRNFFAPLAEPGPIRLIAEVKKASPSRGVIRADFQPVEIARTYEAHGATCLSVLTDREFFQGSLEYLLRCAASGPSAGAAEGFHSRRLPAVRSPSRRGRRRAADCRMPRRLPSAQAAQRGGGVGNDVRWSNCTSRRILPRVFDAGATLIGINNRDLRTFETDLEHTLRLRPRVPDQCVLVSESGIRTRADVVRLEAAGVDAILVGETLMASPDIGAAVDGLLKGSTA